MELRPELDPEHRAVLADWLSARGDPRGELLMLELALEQGQGDPIGLRARLASLRAELEPRWVAELAAKLSVTPAQLDAFLNGRWYAGLLLECCVCPSAELALPEVAPVLLEWTLASEAALALTCLDAGELPGAVVVEQLATGALRPHLRELVIGDFRAEIGALEGLGVQLPELRELELRGPGCVLEGFAAPKLELLRLSPCGDWITPLRGLLARSWPRLERLELRFNWRGYARPEHPVFAQLLNTDRLPALRELELSSFLCCEAEASALGVSSLLGQLRCLGLTDMGVSHEGRERLRAGVEAFAGLERLDIALQGERDGSHSTLVRELQRSHPVLNLA